MVEDEGRAAVPEGLAATDALPAALTMDDSEDDDFNYEQVHVARYVAAPTVCDVIVCTHQRWQCQCMIAAACPTLQRARGR